ncbi:integrase [Bacilli bacterium PM5-3]|nr:integrase [Bacilli bacterium PM5-3]
MMKQEIKNNNKYITDKIEVNGSKYLTKIDKATNKRVYKKQFTASANGVKKTLKTKTWQTSVTKVEHEVQKMRVEFREGLLKKTELNTKHLYSDIVNEYHRLEVKNCINHNRSFEVIDKFLSNNNNYVLNGNYPNLKNRYVEDLTIQEIKQLKKDINTVALKKGLSILTVGHIFTNIDRALKYCAEMAFIDDTIIDNIRIKPRGKDRKKKHEQSFLEKKEYDYLMGVFEKDFKFTINETDEQNKYRKKLYYTYLRCAFFLGFRKSEGFGLTWEDFQQDRIYINATLNTKNVKKYLKTKTYRRIDPKTESSIRKMETPTSIIECLNDWKKYCDSLGIDTSDNNFIFVEFNGKPLIQTTFRNRFNVIIKESNVEEKFKKQLNVHSFRHSCCSFLIQKLREENNKISLREIEIAVGEYLGHSGGDMVKEVYEHLYPSTEDSPLSKVLKKN